MNENKDFIQNEADKLFGDSYRQGAPTRIPMRTEVAVRAWTPFT